MSTPLDFLENLVELHVLYIIIKFLKKCYQLLFSTMHHAQIFNNESCSYFMSEG